jgi:alcohol dehydrogenase
MKAAVYHQHGGTEQIRIEDMPAPVCGPRDAIVQVRAAALNGFDPMMLMKTTGLKTPLPMVPAGDAAGAIVELGAEVDAERWPLGTAVTIYPMVPDEGMTGETRIGACSDYIRIPAASLVRMPDGLGFEAAASLPIAYGTALRMMRVRGRVAAGEKVLIWGATGGVGVACVQLAKAAGAEVIACGSAAWKLERLRQLGADMVIDTSTENVREAVWQRFGKPSTHGGGGVDLVVNYIGGDTWVESLKLLGPGGRMVTCGATAGYATGNDVRYIWSYELTIIGSNGWSMDDQAEVLRMAREREIEPVIHAVRPLAETGAAMQELIDRKVFGKLVLVP